MWCEAEASDSGSGSGRLPHPAWRLGLPAIHRPVALPEVATIISLRRWIGFGAGFAGLSARRRAARLGLLGLFGRTRVLLRSGLRRVLPLRSHPARSTLFNGFGISVRLGLAEAMAGDRLAGKQAAAVPLDWGINQRGGLGEAGRAGRSGRLRRGSGSIVRRCAAVLGERLAGQNKGTGSGDGSRRRGAWRRTTRAAFAGVESPRPECQERLRVRQPALE